MMTAATAFAPVSNDAEQILAIEQPYIADITVEGVSPGILFHAWSVEAVDAKAKAKKGSKAKKEDDVNSYVYRDGAGMLAIPGEYFRMSVINAAKFEQDPRSPRKSAMDLVKAGILVVDELCSLGVKDWDFLFPKRVQVQRNAVTRLRPAMLPGWKVDVSIMVLLPEYIGPPMLNKLIYNAGRLIGVGDFRPSWGRFQINKFQVRQEEADDAS